MLKLEQSKGFKDYTTDVFPPWVRNRLRKVQLTDEKLLSYLCKQLKTIDASEGEVVSTKGERVILKKRRQELDQLAQCSQEEADARSMVYIHDIFRQRYSKAMARNVDTDVVVIALANFDNLV